MKKLFIALVIALFCFMPSTALARGYSSSRSSYSSSRSTSSAPKSSYSSTRSTSSSSKPSTSSSSKPSTSSKGYSSTRTSTKPSSSYKSTRPTITKSNLTKVTTPAQRTTVIHNYYGGYYGVNSFFHPFGWGYGGGDFWFWMWMFDHNQYNQNQQIIQASNVSAPVHSSFWQDLLFIVLIILGLALLFWLIRTLVRHLRWR